VTRVDGTESLTLRKKREKNFCILLRDSFGLTVLAIPSKSQEVLSPPAKAACKFPTAKRFVSRIPATHPAQDFGDLVPFEKCGAPEQTMRPHS